jgi:hypothetical protein
MPTKKAALAKVLRDEEAELERIRALESALHETAASILAASMRAPEIRPDQETPPEAWLEVMKPADAEKALRIAKAAWMSQKDAPVFLKTAQQFLQGSMKVRANENTGPKVLNATIVTTTAPAPVFPERVVRNDDEE